MYKYLVHLRLLKPKWDGLMMLLSDTKIEITNKRVTGSVLIKFFFTVYIQEDSPMPIERDSPPRGCINIEWNSLSGFTFNDFNPFVYFQRVYIGIQQLMSDEKALYNVEMSVWKVGHFPHHHHSIDHLVLDGSVPENPFSKEQLAWNIYILIFLS